MDLAWYIRGGVGCNVLFISDQRRKTTMFPSGSLKGRPDWREVDSTDCTAALSELSWIF